jgi:M6 family metalloprotease-like protein
MDKMKAFLYLLAMGSLALSSCVGPKSEESSVSSASHPSGLTLERIEAADSHIYSAGDVYADSYEGNLVVTAYYSTGDCSEVTRGYEITEYTGTESGKKISPSDPMDEAGTYLFTVTYQDVSAKLEVTVAGEAGDGYYKLSSEVTYHDLDGGYFDARDSEMKILVVPVVWADEASKATDANRSTISDGYFGDAKTGWNSLETYLETASFGRFKVDGFVADWYQSDLSYSDLTSSTDETLFDDIVYPVIRGACAWLGETYPDTDWSEYDKDGNGYIDNIQFVNTGAKNSEYTATWGWQVSLPGNDSTMSLGDGLYVKNMAWFNIDFLSNPEEYVPYPDGSIGNRVIIHEFGHCLGLYDYYDTTYSGASPVGVWDMQDNNCLDWNCFSKFSVGWLDPYVIDGTADSVTLTIPSMEESGGGAIVIPARGHSFTGDAFDEYIILELYTPTGLNDWDSKSITYNYYYSSSETLRGSGVRMYHVDARRNGASLIMNNDYDSSKGQYLLEIVSATQDNHFTSSSGVASGSTFDKAWTSSDLFGTGDVFSVEDYSDFFYGGKMDTGESFGYEITFDSVSSGSATITVSAI